MTQISFLGLRLNSLTMSESVDECARLIEKRDQQHVVLNASKTVLASKDPALVEIINDCGLVNADGQSVVWAARFLGERVPERVAGIDLMNELLDEAPRRGWRVYLLGARQEVIDKVAALVRERGVDVAGYRNGYWTPDTEADVIAGVAEAGADLLFVAMPSPRKEYFLAQNLPRLNVGLAFGVGGSFDVLAGLTKRAPRWMQRSGLEWFYRFVQEPRRMFKRYFVGNAKFAALVLKERFRPKR